MRKIFAVAVVLFSMGVYAQEQSATVRIPEMSEASAPSAITPQPVRSVPTQNILRTTETPRGRVADGKFWLGMSAMTAATVFDAKTTVSALRRPGAYESGFLYGEHPSAGRVYGQALGINAGLVFLSYKLKQKSGRWWWLVPSAHSAVHIAAGLHNQGIR